MRLATRRPAQSWGKQIMPLHVTEGCTGLMFLHRAYGLVIESELHLPCLTAAESHCLPADITISLAESIPDLPDPILCERWWQASPSATRIEIEGVAVYLVEEGRRIRVKPAEGADPAEVRLFLLGSVLGALLYQRGIFPLHGSAVETPWGAMVFAGPSGIGKSTLAAHFHRAGYRLLADDVCAITLDSGGIPQVLPAFPQLRLKTDAIERLYGKNIPAASSNNADKVVVPLGEGHAPMPIPLRTIHVVTDSGKGSPSITFLRGFDSIRWLADNLSRPHLLQGPRHRGRLLRLVAEIAQMVEVVQLSRPRDATGLDGLVQWLEHGWEGRSRLALALEP